MKRTILWNALIFTVLTVLFFIMQSGQFSKQSGSANWDVNKIDKEYFNTWFETRIGTEGASINFKTKVENNGDSGFIYYYRIENTHSYKVAVESKIFYVISKYSKWQSFDWIDLASGETKEFSIVVNDIDSFPAETEVFIGFVKMDNIFFGFLNRLSHNTVGISATAFVPAYYVPIK